MFVHLAEGDRKGAEQIADLWWRREPKNAMLWGMVGQMPSVFSERVRRDPRLLDLAFKIRERRGGKN